MKKCVFIYNPNSGNGSILKYIDYIQGVLEDRYELIIEETKAAGHASQFIRELDNDYYLIISGGGDGTFNEIITGNLNREKEGNNKFVLSHIPCGTANDFRNNFYNSKSIIKIVNDILDGKEINLDIFSLNQDYFYYVVAMGPVATASFSAPHYLKKHLGHFGYILQTLKEISNPSSSFDATCKTDEKIIKGKFSLIIASNSNSVGGIKLEALSDTSFSDGMFEFKTLKYINKFQFIRDILRTITGIEKLDRIKNLQCIKTSSISITFDEIPNFHWSIDGEKRKNIEKEVIIKKAGESRILVPNYTYKKLSI